MAVKPVWHTPNIDQMIVDIARVSSDKPAGTPGATLVEYLIVEGHWSPFEMANICFEVTEYSRDVTRQMLRHDFRFQEFSQRYANPLELGPMMLRDVRMQDKKNRQGELECEDEELRLWWEMQSTRVADLTIEVYQASVAKGIAKGVARAVLPEGMTRTRMYVNGHLRNWLFYVNTRWAEGVQKEHYELAGEVAMQLEDLAPISFRKFMEVMSDA